MNKKGQGVSIGLVIAGIVLLFFVILPWAFNNVTVTYVEFSINNGKISDYKIIEGTTSRINTWSSGYDSGYYNVVISSLNDSKIIKEIEKTGRLKKSVYINQYVDCVNITVIDSTMQQFLDTKIMCKNEETR